MKKALFIVGPTAVGKTALAFNISQILPSILISADSIQVYKKADIISGKDLPPASKFIRDHYLVELTSLYLLDVVLPSKSFSVDKFVKQADKVIKKAKKENKTPIIVGGTGFYADALLGKFDTIFIPPDITLRNRLEKQDVLALQKKLKKVDPARFKKMNTSDLKNKRRLIRAIEVAGFKKTKIRPVIEEKDSLIIGLKTSRDNLKTRILKRIKRRIEDGAVKEAETLFKDYKSVSSQIKSANGYRQLFDYFLGKLTFEEVKEKWAASEYQHARRQMIWFRRNKNIVWFNTDKKGYEKDILKLVKRSFTTA